jgi:hypothetical protein
MAHVNQVDRAQLFRANALPGPLVPAALSTEELEYVPHSENDAAGLRARVSTAHVLERVAEWKRTATPARTLA